MNKKLLLPLILCSFASVVFSDDFFAEKVGEWPESLKNWRQSTGVSDCESRYLGKDILGRNIAEVTSPRGMQYHFYRVEGENGPLSETARPVGTNKEVALVKAYNKATGITTFIWPEQAEFIKSCVETDQLEVLSEDIPVLYDGTSFAPDGDPFEKKIKKVAPRLQQAYQEVLEELEGLKKELQEAQNIIRDQAAYKCAVLQFLSGDSQTETSKD